MCGILGYFDSDSSVELGPFVDVLATLYHRGPDSGGYRQLRDGHVLLGHRRLSIIDLSPFANQPFHLDSHGYTLVFNGEIYNHKELRLLLISQGIHFKTSSDTEVVLNAYIVWGKDCFRRFDGMFAIAIYDQRQDILVLSRDRFGEKPLFYTLIKSGFIFASELSALLKFSAVDACISPQALSSYLHYGFVPSPMTMVDRVFQVDPGSLLTYSLSSNNLSTERYWTPSMKSHLSSENSFQALEEKLEFHLDRCIKKQLCADVPVGVLLSGGVDSSLITAIASRHTSQLNTYTLSFPGNPSIDETFHARLISQYYSTNHTVIPAELPTPDTLVAILKTLDTPLPDSSYIASHLLFKSVSQYGRVFLGGDGGDELFAGYSKYSRFSKINRYNRFIPDGLNSFLPLFASKCLPLGFKGRSLLQALAYRPCSYIPHIDFFDTVSYSKLSPLLSAIKPCKLSDTFNSDTDSPEKHLIHTDASNYLPNNILIKSDRSSMSHSLEVRSPFLDHRVAEFTFKYLNSKDFCSPTQRKIFLKRFSQKFLPTSFDLRRKQGFCVPLRSWFTNKNFVQSIRDILLTADSPFNQSYVDWLISSINFGFSNEERIYSLLSFEVWRKQNSVKF